MKKIFLPIIIVFISLFLSSCVEIQKPILEKQNYKLHNISLKKAKASVQYTIHNPNPVSTTQVNYSYIIKIQDIIITKKKGILPTLNAFSSSNITIPIECKYNQIFKNDKELLNSLLSASNNIYYQITGSIKSSILNTKISIPLTDSGIIRLPKLPELAIQNIMVEKIDDNALSIKLTFSITNYNAYTIPIDNFTYNITITNQLIASGTNTNSLDISPLKNKKIDISVNINKTSFSQYLEIINKGIASYRIEGIMSLAGLPLPFSKSGNIHFLLDEKTNQKNQEQGNSLE